MRQLRLLIVEKSQAAGRGWPPRAARRWSGWWRPGRGEGVRNPRCGRVGEEEEEKTKEPGTGDLRVELPKREFGNAIRALFSSKKFSIL